MKRLEVRACLKAMRDVEGWLFPIDAYLFGLIDEVQKRENIEGGLFEIGVHHGKTAIVLARMARASETLGVCDVFERQELNRDRSGEGSRELFLRNLHRCSRLPGERLRLFARESASLTVTDTTDDVRFFHIDGGHRPEDVLMDLATAARALRPDGVVVVDDVFNPSWPGVGEGTLRFLIREAGVFVPIVIGGNKVFFARPDAARLYERYWPDTSAMRAVYDGKAFAFQRKGWFGREVLTAVRRTWVDLDPVGAASAHLGDDVTRRPVASTIVKLLG